MEREIKFNVWDRKAKTMYREVSWSRLCGLGDEGYTLLQYTGLHDKNGKEIYEGDIVKFTEIDEDSCFGREESNIVEVKWIEETAQYRAVFKSGRRTELHLVVQLPTVTSCEIIGNIYEHGELLNK